MSTGLFLLFLGVLLPSALYSGGDDVLIMKNGDRLVGEIKEMKQGILRFETDYGDKDFEIEWKKIRQIESQAWFVVVLSNGDRYVGHLKSNPTDSSKLKIVEQRGTWEVNHAEVIFIKPVKESLRDRLNAHLDFGYSLTKAHNAQQLNLSTAFSYITRTWLGNVNFTSVNSMQSGAPKSRTSDGQINYRRFLLGHWFGVLSATFRSSDEQQLNLRSTANIGGGKFFIQTNQLYFMAVLGAALTSENYRGEDIPDKKSTEGLIQIEFNAFDTGDLDFYAQLSAYPSFTESKRLRLVLNSNLKWKLPYDFYFKISYNHNFDSAPPSEVSKNDYTFTTSIGWEL